jgi:ribosomal protein S18 acetylase RimI-like enzyme
MEIIKLIDYNKPEKLYNLCNEEFGFIFPITEELFQKNVYNYGKCALNYSFVAIEKEEVLGFIIGKVWDDKYEVKGYESIGWISLLYVKPSVRRQGIGTLLTEKIEKIFKEENKAIIYLGKDYCNFFPGLPVELKIHRSFFEKRGYTLNYDTNDLIKKVTEKTPLEILKPYKDGKNYLIRRANVNDFPMIDNLLKKNWPGRWHMEFLDYVNNGGNGNEYMICIDENNVVCGFCKVCDITTPLILSGYSMNFYDRFEFLGGIGPLGVDIEYRKRNIANNILKTIINELINKKVSEIIIDWTNLMHIYQKYGFEIWKSYTYVYKEIE